MPPKRITIRDHTAEANLFARRAFITFIIVVIMIAVLLTNLHHLQVDLHNDYQTRSNDNRIKVIPVAPNRGLIYDRNGKLLAENKAVFSLEVIPEQVDDLTETLKAVSELIYIDEDKQKQILERAKYHRRFKPLEIKASLSDKEVAVFSVNQQAFPGVQIEARLKRHYPYKDTLTHALGYVSKITKKELQRLTSEGKDSEYAATNEIGKLGVEKFYEDALHGKVGHEEVEVNNRGRVIRSLRFEPPVAGEDLHLHLDVDLQTKAQTLLEGQRGAIVAMDPNTGGVMALYSNPSYDPNWFVSGISVANYRSIITNKQSPLLNRATQGRYPPASTVKPHLGLLGLDEGKVTPETRVWDPGFYIIKGTTTRKRDWWRQGHGHVNVYSAIAQSCDTYFYDLAYNLGIDKITDMMAQFGFGSDTGLDILEESQAVLPSRGWKRAKHNKPWYKGDTVNIGIGQGYWTVTPIQLATSISAIANRGRMVVPKLLEYTSGHNGTTLNETVEKPPVLVNNKDNWDVIHKAMHMVVNDERGSVFRTFRKAKYDSAGKTGTAQVAALGEDEKYDAKTRAEHLRDNSLYVGFAPFDKPEIVIVVVVENALGGGSKVAAPMAKKFLDFYFDNKPVEPMDVELGENLAAN